MSSELALGAGSYSAVMYMYYKDPRLSQAIVKLHHYLSIYACVRRSAQPCVLSHVTMADGRTDGRTAQRNRLAAEKLSALA